MDCGDQDTRPPGLVSPSAGANPSRQIEKICADGVSGLAASTGYYGIDWSSARNAA
jgi:hypothetical protein